MIQTKIIFISKHQNKAEFKSLDDSEVLSSDFPGLRYELLPTTVVPRSYATPSYAIFAAMLF